MAKQYWRAAHRNGRDLWDAAMGARVCPHCRHAQSVHEVDLQPGTLIVTIQCWSCGPYSASTRTCIAVPGPYRRAQLIRPRRLQSSTPPAGHQPAPDRGPTQGPGPRGQQDRRAQGYPPGQPTPAAPPRPAQSSAPAPAGPSGRPPTPRSSPQSASPRPPRTREPPRSPAA